MAPRSDKDLFFASLALFDRDESELRHKIFDEDVDLDAAVERGVEDMLRMPSIIPL
jgi:hypothetical protein